MVAVSPSILTNFESATKKSYALSFSCNWANSKKRVQNCSSCETIRLPSFSGIVSNRTYSYSTTNENSFPQAKFLGSKLYFKTFPQVVDLNSHCF